MQIQVLVIGRCPSGWGTVSRPSHPAIALSNVQSWITKRAEHGFEITVAQIQKLTWKPRLTSLPSPGPNRNVAIASAIRSGSV